MCMPHLASSRSFQVCNMCLLIWSSSSLKSWLFWSQSDKRLHLPMLASSSLLHPQHPFPRPWSDCLFRPHCPGLPIMCSLDMYVVRLRISFHDVCLSSLRTTSCLLQSPDLPLTSTQMATTVTALVIVMATAMMMTRCHQCRCVSTSCRSCL